MNRVEMVGRITNDLNLKKTRDGVSVLNFGIAVKRPHTSDKTDFFNVSCFRQSADFLAKYAKKGTMVAISGMLMTSQYTDGSGRNVTSVSIAAEEVEITEAKKQQQEEFVVTEDDLPF